MEIKTRTVRRYDHRLRDLVRSTGDTDYATRHGVPRSTARGWLTSARAAVVSAEVVDMDTSALQKEVLRLQKRVAILRAFLRLLVVLLRVSGFSLDKTRLPEGDRKQRLLRAIDRSCSVPATFVRAAPCIECHESSLVEQPEWALQSVPSARGENGRDTLPD